MKMPIDLLASHPKKNSHFLASFSSSFFPPFPWGSTVDPGYMYYVVAKFTVVKRSTINWHKFFLIWHYYTLKNYYYVLKLALAKLNCIRGHYFLWLLISHLPPEIYVRETDHKKNTSCTSMIFHDFSMHDPKILEEEEYFFFHSTMTLNPYPKEPNHQQCYEKWKLSRNMYKLHTCFCTFGADSYAQSALINKISALELRRKFIKDPSLVGISLNLKV